jgi:hypothetical protein
VAAQNEMRQTASVVSDVPRRETQGDLLQEQVNECTNISPTVKGIGLLWGVSCVGNEAPIACIREGSSVVTSRVEVLEKVEDVVETFLVRGAHGIVETNGLGQEVDSNEDPVAAVHVDGEEKIMQGENVNFLAHWCTALNL